MVEDSPLEIALKEIATLKEQVRALSRAAVSTVCNLQNLRNALEGKREMVLGHGIMELKVDDAPTVKFIFVKPQNVSGILTPKANGHGIIVPP